jgi:tRNA (cmo5U34)-methyltransferase
MTKTTSFDFSNYSGEEFADHIAKSIPNYNGMRETLPMIAENFLVKNSNIYDIGCSAGDLLLQLHHEFKDFNNDLSYIGYDIAERLLPKTSPNGVNFFNRDVTEESLTMFNTSLVFSLFTLQFIPLDKRTKLVKKIYSSLSKRGAFIVCEKVYSSYGITEDIFTFANYKMKADNDFSAEEILIKQDDLKHIMFPLSQAENEKMFKDAGFKVVEVFFKSLNFMGWILIK